MNAILVFLFNCFIFEISALNNFADVQCGLNPNKRKARIVGGENAQQAEFPWIVSITRRGNHFCGGTLINKKFVLTAGHCLCTGSGNDQIKPNSIKVAIAQHDLSKQSGEAYTESIKSVIVHPEYSCKKVKNDIAILELENEVSWSDSVSPACLPAENTDQLYRTYDNILAVVAGWGWTNEVKEKGGRATVLQKAQVNVIDEEKCRSWYKSQGKKTKIQKTQMCAGHEHGQIDACWADSGGPLMVKSESEKQMTVVGVVSTGIGCARPYLPGIYTRVSEYISWIKQVIAQ